jgi:hypothetical protein
VVNQIVVSAVRPRTGALRAIPGVFGCTRGSTGPLCQDVQVGLELVVADDGRSAYQIVGEQILVFNRDPTRGSLELLPDPSGCLRARADPVCTATERVLEPSGMRLSPDGRHLYVVSEEGDHGGRNEVVGFARTQPVRG